MTESVNHFVLPDERELDEMRALCPTYPYRGVHRALDNLDNYVLLRWIPKVAAALNYNNSGSCVYCGRKGRGRTMAVNPITLQRSYFLLCHRSTCNDKLRAFEGKGESRLRRARWDWEQQHPTEAAEMLIGTIPAQYPSVNRSVLRAFMESDMNSATVDAGDSATVASLNAIIKSLGFDQEVFAEIRSKKAVLRKVEAHS